MLPRLLMAVALVLSGASPARATVQWLSGFESQAQNLECPLQFVSTWTLLDTTTSRSGSVALELTHGSASQVGKCGVYTSQSYTGTIYIAFGLRVGLLGGDCSPAISGNILRLNAGNPGLKLTCTNGVADYAIQAIDSAGTAVNSPYSITTGQWYQIVFKIVTGSGSGTLEWFVNGVSQGSPATGLTLASLTDMAWWHPQSTTGASTVAVFVDDVVQGTLGANPGTTYVNMRKGNAAGTYNTWTKTASVGGGSNIYDVWTSSGPRTNVPSTWHGALCYAGTNDGASCTVASQCPSGTCQSGFAQSATGDDTNGQTMKFAAWDSGTPTPTIPASATNVSDIWGCRWDTVAGRDTGTNRTYQLRRRYASTNNDSVVTFSSNVTYFLSTLFFDVSSANVAQELIDLNAMELGGFKSATASGAAMDIEDLWLQCAWSVSASASPPFVWVIGDDH